VVPPSGPARPGQAHVEAGRLWAGGAATAVVAALVAFVGVVITQNVFDVPMVEPPLLPVGDAFALRYALTAAALALVATGVGHLLVLTTPRPRSFFGWIVGLATVVGVVLPFTVEGTLGSQLATAVVNLVIGLCVLSLLSSVLARTASAGPPRTGTAPPTWQ
jgi:nitric oxide reductase large subunit